MAEWIISEELRKRLRYVAAASKDERLERRGVGKRERERESERESESEPRTRPAGNI
jgi:hypothetical protein